MGEGRCWKVRRCVQKQAKFIPPHSTQQLLCLTLDFLPTETWLTRLVAFPSARKRKKTGRGREREKETEDRDTQRPREKQGEAEIKASLGMHPRAARKNEYSTGHLSEWEKSGNLLSPHPLLSYTSLFRALLISTQFPFQMYFGDVYTISITGATALSLSPTTT